MSDLSKLTLKQAVDQVKKGELTPEDLINDQIARIEADQKEAHNINAVVHYDKERAVELSKAANKDSLLAGVPIFIKSLMHLKNYPAHACSKILKNYVSPYTGGACRNLLASGGSVVGITNMDEFAMGSSNETSYFGVVRNPINRDYIPGGSSGGSAAVVASGQGLASLGSDTGGSIRQPASCCGIVGIKPTYGRVSRYGMIAFASSFDQIGPLTKTVEDAALLLQAIAGFDHRDSTSIDEPVPNYMDSLEKPIGELKIALPKEFFSDLISEEIRNEVEKSIDFYRQAGCKIETVSIPSVDSCLGIYYILATAEASSNLARFDGIRYGDRNKDAQSVIDIYFKTRGEDFGKEVKRRILTGSYVLSSGHHDAYYLKAQKARRAVYNEYMDVFKSYDAILTPTVPNRVFKIGEKMQDPIEMYYSDLCTVSANVVGLPGISVPCGKDANGLPISFQLLSKPFQESTLFNLGHAYQKENPITFI